MPEPMNIAHYRDRYPRSRFIIVGKGPTAFDYDRLADAADPVIFINDAVQFEALAARAPETFFFAHDRCQAVYLSPGLQSTAVVPRAGAVDRAGNPLLTLADVPADGPRRLVGYEWPNFYGFGKLAAESRRDVARAGRLFIHSGTIHTAIHFAWLAGARSIAFVGCDGAAGGYDPRITLMSKAAPLGVFGKIRQAQDRELQALRLESEYIPGPDLVPSIPRRAHSIWFGPRVPSWALENVATFRRLHPDWDVTLHRTLPETMPADLYDIAQDAEQICQRADVLRLWLLWSEGGVYIDPDVIPIRSFEPLRYSRAFGGRQHDGRINNAVLGAAPKSAAIGRALEAVRALGKSRGPRARFGCGILTKIVDGAGAPPFVVRPRHYFYLLIDNKEAYPYRDADRDGRAAVLADKLRQVQADGYRYDGVPPYAVHLWGIDGSSKRAPFGRGDALALRLRRRHAGEDILGAEVGVLSGRLSEHLLREIPGLTLLMVDRWNATDADTDYARSGDTAAQATAAQMEAKKGHALARTAFAEDRRRILHGESVAMARHVADESLDFVFIDADHTYGGVVADLRAWYPKVKPGGLVSGHDIDNPADPGYAASLKTRSPLWGVRPALVEFMAEAAPGLTFEIGGEYTWYFTKPDAPAASIPAAAGVLAMEGAR